MPWGWFKWPEYLKKKACRYLLQHYLGNYLETKISLEDLTVNLYNGTATVSNVPLSAEALNESLQNVNAPIRIVSGCIGEVNVTIPWKALIRDNCTVQISGLKLVVTPQVFSNYTTGAMMTESLLFSTMSASLQVAEELLKTKSVEEETEAAGYEGMEAFARAIEIVLARVKVSLTDTIIQVNYENTDSSKLFLRLKIERIDFFDERSRIPSDEEAEVTVTDIAVKILQLSKPLLEFGHESCEQDHIDPSPLDTLTGLHQQSSDGVKGQVDEASGVLVGMASGRMEVKVKVKQTETVPGPKLEIEGFLAAIHFLFTHEDLLLLTELINGIIKSSGDSERVIPIHKYQHNIPGISRPMQTKDRDQVERQLQRHMEQSRHSDHQRRDPWDLQSSGADSGDDFHSLEINAYSELTSPTTFSDPNSTSVYSDTSASIYKSTFALPPDSPLSPDFPIQKPFAFKDPTKKISIPSGGFTMPDRDSPVSQKFFGNLNDTSVYKFTISCFTFALLHKKPYYKSVDVETSVDPMEYQSLNDRGELCPLTYFDSMSQAVLTGRVLKGSDPNDKISQVLPLDHLLLSAQTVSTTVTVTGPSTKLHLSVGGTNIREYIYQNHLSRITKPVAINSVVTLTEDVHNIKPAVELNYSFTDDPEYRKKLHRFGKQFRDGKVPEAKLGVELHSVHVELDPTLVDRLNIINKIPSFTRQSSSPDSFDKDVRSLYLPMSNANLRKQDYFDAALGDTNSIKQQTTIMVTCNTLNIILKFPVPDLREGGSVKVHNQPKLRQELCYADVSSIMFKTCLSDSKLTKYEAQLESLKAYLSASGRKEDRTLFLLVESDRHDNNRVYSDLPRIVFEARTVLESELEDDLCTEDHTSMDDSSFLPSFSKKPSPFATSKTMFETSETGKSDEWREEVMPGSREEIYQFEEATKDRASNVLKCFLPTLRLHLPNQSLYSKLYHRFAQDIPLWQSLLVKQSKQASTTSVHSTLHPLADVTTLYPLTDPTTDPMTQTIRPHHIQQPLSSFKPLHRDDSSGEEDEDDGPMSTVIPKRLQDSRQAATTTTTTVLSLVVGRAQLSLCTDVAGPTEIIDIDEKKEKLVDVDSPKRTSSQSDPIGGIAVFDVTQFTLTSITGYNGDPTLDYLCLQIDKFNISHYSSFDMDQFSKYSCVSDCADVEKLLHAHLLPIITPAPGNMLISGDCDSHKRDPMLAIAMEITSDPEHNTKTNKCAIAVRNGLLEYFVTPSELNCFTQLIQFFGIQNEEIAGYIPKPVITALHVHFIDSTAVYRPKYLPWQMAFGISAGHFSTTLASAATTSMMRLIIDECYVFLTNKPEKNLDLKQDYVCVVEIGLLELNIKMQTGDIPESLNIPEMSLEFSNNLIEFRTCVDTCAGLRDLIQYIASYGDLRDFVLVKAKSFDSCKDDTESVDGFSTPLGSLTSNTSIPLPSGVNQMDLMDDAMAELAIENTGSNKRTDKVYKPSRDKRKSPGTKRKSSCKKPSAEIKMKLSNPNLKSIKVPVNFSDSDDDSHVAVNKKLTGKHAGGPFPLSPARSSMSSTMTSEESEDDFLILDLPISSRMAKGAKPVIKSHLNDDEILKIEPNHFTPSNSFTDQLHRPENFPIPVTVYTLKDMNVIWYLYGGSDFQKSSTPSPVCSSGDHSTSPATKHKELHPRQDLPSTSSPTSQSRPSRGSPHSTRSHLNSSGIRYKRTSNTSESTHYKKKTHKGRMLNWKIAGGPDRNHDVVMEIHINKLRMQHEVYPEDTTQSTRFVLLVREVELVDRLAASQLNKFLSQYVSNTMPKQTHANMVSFKMLSIRTELEEYPDREEVIVHASALPLRLYIDQDALEFLVNFMGDLSTIKTAEAPPPAEVFEQPSSLSSTDQTGGAATTPDCDSAVEPTYFKEFSFYPSIVIKIDYEAKRFDMEKGVIPGILVGLSHLDSAEIELRSLKFCGVLGWDRLLAEIVNEWTSDVKSQLPKILGGVGPMHYLMQFAQGVVDFVWLPVQQYQQDGRVVRGLQRGATSLAASTGMATVELTTRLVQTIEFIAATTYDFVAPVDRNSNSSLALQRRRNPRRPQDFRSGVNSAWKTLTTGINDTAGDLYHTVTREHDEGVARTLGEVLRQVPGVVVRPILIASEATRHVLGGVRNQLMPDARKEELAKYCDDT